MRLALLALFILIPLSAQPRAIDPPTPPDSGMPFLTAGPNGAVYLSWIEPAPNNEHALRFSQWTGTQWTPPETIAHGPHWFVNWADFPSLSVLPDRSILAHWLTRSAAGNKFGYGIRVAKRAPDSPVWRETHGISLDEKVDYAGFLTFSPGARAAVYLAPPAEKAQPAAHGDHEHGHRKTARFILFNPDGAVESDKEIDADVCSCCQTALGKTSTGWIAAYRDHQPGEIRDISIVRYNDGVWSAPRTLHPDGWKINGCPTEGPSILARDKHVAIAWLTRANAQPKVQLTLSANDGRDFSAPLRIDSGNPLGRPHITAFDDTHYLVTWLEKATDDHNQIRLRLVSNDGALSAPIVSTKAPVGRAAGFPKAIVTGDKILLTWRDERVRALLIPKSDFKVK
jgi:hypothetical protein